eukprot:215897_1
MMRYHIRPIVMQAELFMTNAIGHNSGAFHPGIESGHILLRGKFRSIYRLLRGKFLDAPELNYRLSNRPINKLIDRPNNRLIHMRPHRPLQYIKLYVIDNIRIIPELNYRLSNRPINKLIDRPNNRLIHMRPHRPLQYIKLYVIDNIRIIYAWYTRNFFRTRYMKLLDIERGLDNLVGEILDIERGLNIRATKIDEIRE